MDNQNNDFLYKRCFCSWSGGKDSSLALYRMLKARHSCAALFSLLDESGIKSRSHGLPMDMLRAHAQSIGIPLRMIKAPNFSCEEEYRNQLCSFRQENISPGIFGDIDLLLHREWIERVCIEAGVQACFPLWKENRRDMVCEFIREGFKAVIVAVERKKLPETFLGRMVDTDLIDEHECMGIDACGENGEFHTFVLNGPTFRNPLKIVHGAIENDDIYNYLSLSVQFS